jgi:hypothetical protein
MSREDIQSFLGTDWAASALKKVPDLPGVLAQHGQHYVGVFWRNDKPGGIGFTLRDGDVKGWAGVLARALPDFIRDLQNDPTAKDYFLGQLRAYADGDRDFRNEDGSLLSRVELEALIALNIIALVKCGMMPDDEYNGVNANFPLPWAWDTATPPANKKREPRLADIVLQSPAAQLQKSPWWTPVLLIERMQQELRKAEKFFLPDDAIQQAIKGADKERLEAQIPIYARFPYEVCWLEMPLQENDRDYTHGFLVITSDETRQRGFATMFTRDNATNAVAAAPATIGFDFTEEFTGYADGDQGLSAIRMAEDTPQSAALKRILERFSFHIIAPLSREDQDKIVNLFGNVFDQMAYEILTVMFINMPKEIVTILREDLTQYNKLRRGLGQKKAVRQEYHLVSIATTKEVFADETERLFRRASEPTGITRGEHDVRGHYRTYRSGLKVWVRDHKRGSGECKSKRRGYLVETMVETDD